jgi:hypothetical protein
VRVSLAAVGITLPSEPAAMAEQLKLVQAHLEAGHESGPSGASVHTSDTHSPYADFYDLRHVLILGRVTSGRGGALILGRAKAVLADEFPDLAHLDIRLPDEKTRRVGQSIAAASLPALRASKGT